MKRILLIPIAVLAFAFTSSAQGWRQIEIHADELTKEKAQTVWIYEDELGNEFYYYTKSKFAIATCADGIVDYQTNALGDVCRVFVGFYSDGVMENRKRYTLMVSKDSKSFSFGNYSKKIYQWLQEPNHAIRIVTGRYGKSNLDMMITAKEN